MDETEGLSEGLLEHLRRLHGAGDLPPAASSGAEGTAAIHALPAVCGRGENPACGDVLELTGALDGEGHVRLAFRASACGAVLATASVLCEAVGGADLEAARRFDLRAAVERLGGLPRHRSHALRVVGRAFEQVLARLDSPR
jgi:NifU-like protein involved in Fe-S cluster formation